VDGLPVARGGDRGERGAAQPRGVPVHLDRYATVLDVLFGRAIAVGHAVERIVAGRGDGLAAHQRIEDAGGGADRRLHGGTAVLFATGEVARYQDVQRVAGFEQELEP